jgi:hypothetical protein
MRVNDASNPGDAAWEDIDGGREAPKNVGEETPNHLGML